MAKLLKHLGIGGKKPSPNSPKLEYDPQRFDRARGHQVDPSVGLHLPTGNDTDSSSTVSSAATVGSDEFPPPPSAWTLEQALGDNSGQAFGGARPKEIKGSRQHARDELERHKHGGGSSFNTTDSDFVEVPKNLAKKPSVFEAANIYENQAMFDTSLQLVDSESLQEVKKWLGELNLDSSLDVTSNPPVNAARDIRSRMAFDVQLKQKDKVHSHADASGKALPRAAEKVLPGGKRAPAVKSTDNDVAFSAVKKEQESEYEKSNPATREPDYERYTQLRDELKFELEELSEIPEEELLVEQDAFDLPIPSEETQMIRSDGYEEPWDLEAAQGEIEDQFNGVLVGEWILREMPATADKNAQISSQANEPAQVAAHEGAIVGQPPPHELDIRTQKGYEKPWDWKPHMKDDRGPEGYEKPWDWKPHMKDDRPPKEYEEPWDKKAKNVENEVIAAKIAKEAAKAGKDAVSAGASAVGASAQSKITEDLRGKQGYDKPWDLKPHLKDGRPPNEYEEPWDTKAKDIESELIAAKIAKEAAKVNPADGAAEKPVVRPPVAGGANAERIGAKRNVKDGRVHVENEALGNLKRTNQVIRTVSEDSVKPSRPAVSSPAQRHLRLSPKKKTGLTPDLESSPKNRIGERIQTRIPLKEQRWYHGTISRGDAESILHGHKEGSYLVRHSESGTDEFSLSVKSSRGFMHMKIVVDREGKYILGQFSQPFVSIPQMIQYYTVSKLPIKGAEHMSLLYPVIQSVL